VSGVSKSENREQEAQVLLDRKNAVIYGAGGSVGGAVAQVFAREGARVYLAGRTATKLEAVADRIRAAGGLAETAQLDALDEQAVDAHADAMAAEAGSIDISFNLISHGDVQGTPMAEMKLDDYVLPVLAAVTTTFLTWRAGSRHMVKQGSGVILAFRGERPRPRGYYLGALQVAFHAVESMRRRLASELGADGVGVVTLRTGGVPESIPEAANGRDAIAEGIERATMLGRAATLDDVGRVAAFVACDQARTMTAATVNVSSGALID
jgi:3-oxoacyl-[acyl-carrier protein] reductase